MRRVRGKNFVRGVPLYACQTRRKGVYCYHQMQSSRWRVKCCETGRCSQTKGVFPAVPRRVRCEIDAAYGGALFFCGPLRFREVFFYVHKSVQVGFRIQEDRAARAVHCGQRACEFSARRRHRRQQQDSFHLSGMLFRRVFHGAGARLHRRGRGGCDRLSYPAFGSVLVFRRHARAVRLSFRADHERYPYKDDERAVCEGLAYFYRRFSRHHLYRQLRRQLLLYVSVLLGRRVQKGFLDLSRRQAGPAVGRLCGERRPVHAPARAAI